MSKISFTSLTLSPLILLDLSAYFRSIFPLKSVVVLLMSLVKAASATSIVKFSRVGKEPYSKFRYLGLSTALSSDKTAITATVFSESSFF